MILKKRNLEMGFLLGVLDKLRGCGFFIEGYYCRKFGKG